MKGRADDERTFRQIEIAVTQSSSTAKEERVNMEEV